MSNNLLGLLIAAIAAVIAIPAGWAIRHTGRGREFAVALSGAARAIPTLGLVVLLYLLIGVVYKTEAAVVAFVVLAIPSIRLTDWYTARLRRREQAGSLI